MTDLTSALAYQFHNFRNNVVYSQQTQDVNFNDIQCQFPYNIDLPPDHIHTYITYYVCVTNLADTGWVQGLYCKLCRYLQQGTEYWLLIHHHLEVSTV